MTVGCFEDCYCYPRGEKRNGVRLSGMQPAMVADRAGHVHFEYVDLDATTSARSNLAKCWRSVVR